MTDSVVTVGTSRFPQTPSTGPLRGRALARWDEILPPLPEELWKSNLQIIERQLSV